MLFVFKLFKAILLELGELILSCFLLGLQFGQALSLSFLQETQSFRFLGFKLGSTLPFFRFNCGTTLFLLLSKSLSPLLLLLLEPGLASPLVFFHLGSVLGFLPLDQRNPCLFFQSALSSELFIVGFSLKASFLLFSDPPESDFLLDLDLSLPRLFSLDETFLTEDFLLLLADALLFRLCLALSLSFLAGSLSTLSVFLLLTESFCFLLFGPLLGISLKLLLL